jgi:hypothetical protein
MPEAMQLFFVCMIAIALIGVLERVARRRWGVVLGVPIATLVEDYPVSIGTPREVDLDPHLYDVAHIEWVDESRLLILPAGGEVHMSAHVGARGLGTSTGFICLGDLRIDAQPNALHFRTRVLVRVMPLLGALLFMFGPYVPLPLGMGWPLPGGRAPLFLSLWPLVLFGGIFGFTTLRARSRVITAHHAVTSAFMQTPAQPRP